MNATVMALVDAYVGKTREVVELKQLQPRAYREYLDNGIPFVLRGGASHWRALNLWNADYFRSVVGHRPLYIKTYDPAARHKTPKMKRTTVAEFLDIQSGPDAPGCRIGDVPIEDFLPELQRDVEVPWLVTHSWFRTGLFVGRDSFCAVHYHTHDEAVLTQVSGTKTVVLYSPRQTRSLYPVPWYVPFSNWSQVNVEYPDHERFPHFKDAEMFVVTLHPGDMLFIPIHWWHATFGAGFSVSLTYFWLANLKRWAFPFPGLRVLLSPYALLIPFFLFGRRLRGLRSQRKEAAAASRTAAQ